MIRVARVAFFGLALLAGWHVFYGAERKVALVIASSDYRFAPAIAGTREPLATIAKHLDARGYAVTVLTNPDRTALRTTLSEFVQAADGATDAAFVFSGYAIAADGANYLAPIDAAIWAADDLAHEAMPLEPVITALHERTRRATIVLDAARDHPFAATLRAASPRLAVGTGLAPISVDHTVTVALSAAPGLLVPVRDAADATRRNVFLASIADALEDTDLAIADALKSARAVVIAETRGRQVPWESASLAGQMVTGPVVADRLAPITQPAQGAAEQPAIVLGSGIVAVSDAKGAEVANGKASGPSWFTQFRQALRESAILGGSRARDPDPAAPKDEAQRPADTAPVSVAGKSLERVPQLGEPVATLNLSQGQGKVPSRVLNSPAAVAREAERAGLAPQKPIVAPGQPADRETVPSQQAVPAPRVAPAKTVIAQSETTTAPAQRTEPDTNAEAAITVRGITVQAAALGNLPKEPQTPQDARITQAGLTGIQGLAAAARAQDPIVAAALATGGRRQVRLALQTELERRGCYSGAIDGVWGQRSRRALKDLSTLHSAALPERRPSVSLLQYLVDRPALACVAGCGTSREGTENARCQVALSRPTSAISAGISGSVATAAGVRAAANPPASKAANAADPKPRPAPPSAPRVAANRPTVERDYLPRSKPKGAMALGMVPQPKTAHANGPTIVIGNKVYRMKRTASTVRVPAAENVRAIRQATKWRKQVRMRRLYREAFGFEPIR